MKFLARIGTQIVRRAAPRPAIFSAQIPPSWEKNMLNRLRDVFGSLERHDVHYVVIGGIAAVVHGVPRATFDLDILIEPSAENVRRLLDALADAALGTALQTSEKEILEHEITIFKNRVRVDVRPFFVFFVFFVVKKRMRTGP